MSIGDYVPTEYNNGAAPAIDKDNLNNNEEKTNELDKDLKLQKGFNLDTYKDYVLNKSIKLIDDFEDYSLWSTLGTSTLSKDYARRFGINRIRIEENDNTAGYLGMDKTIAALDLETFEDGLNTSSTSDLIQFAFVLTDGNTVHLNVRIRLGTDSSNYYEWIIPGASLAFGTNLHSNPKSSFTTTGSPDWGAITYISIEWESSANQNGEALRAEWIDMERVESGGSVANPWVLDNGGGNWNIKLMTPILNTITFLNTSTGNISIAVGGQGNETTDPSVKVYEDASDFYIKIAALCAGPTMTGGVIWYIDSNNYIEFVATDFDGYFKINEVIAGVPANVVDSALYELNFKEKFYLYIEKKGYVIHATLKQGTKKMQLNFQTLLDGPGDLYLSNDYYNANGWYGGSILEKLIVSNTDVPNPLDWDWSVPFVLMKYDDEDITSDATLENDTELQVRLPPNTIFKVEVFIDAIANSSTPDLRVGYSLGDNEIINDSRLCIGPAWNANVIESADNMQVGSYGETDEVRYGLLSGGGVSIRENFILKTGPNYSDTRFRLNWSQWTSSADYSRVRKGSHIVFTKVNLARTPYYLSY